MCNLKYKNLEKKQCLKAFVFITGVGILIWQIRVTFQAFMEGKTTFTVSKQILDKISPPAIVVCPIIEFDNGILTNGTQSNVSDKDWYEQFFQLNGNLNIKLMRWAYNWKDSSFEQIKSNFRIGENFDEDGKTFLGPNHLLL